MDAQSVKYLYGYMLMVLLALGCKENRNVQEQEQPPIISKDVLTHLVTNTKQDKLEDRIWMLDNILQVAEKDSTLFVSTIDTLEKPLSNPNSSYRNETLHIKVLEAKMNSNWYTKKAKQKFKKELDLALQNEVGNLANDFAYITPDGTQHQLYDSAADHTLLFFYNPECPACKDTKNMLMTSPVINHKLKTGELAVLSMYIDKDLEVWQNHLYELPQDWIAAHDTDEHIYKNGIYDVRAIPSLYLLDENKTVVLKDATKIGDIENRLIMNN